MLFGEKPAELDKVLAKFEEVSKDTLNTKLEFEYNPSADHKQKMQLKMSTAEPVDLMFDAPWMNLYNNISLGYYQQLDKYFNNDQYPGLKKAFPPELLEANKINGHIYSIPFLTAYTDPQIINIRKDIREELGMQPVKSLDDFRKYLDGVQAKHPDYVAVSCWKWWHLLAWVYRKRTGVKTFDWLQPLQIRSQAEFRSVSPCRRTARRFSALQPSATRNPNSLSSPLRLTRMIRSMATLQRDWNLESTIIRIRYQAKLYQALDPAKNGSREGALSRFTNGNEELRD